VIAKPGQDAESLLVMDITWKHNFVEPEISMSLVDCTIFPEDEMIAKIVEEAYTPAKALEHTVLFQLPQDKAVLTTKNIRHEESDMVSSISSSK